jgi:hypothetical protein
MTNFGTFMTDCGPGDRLGVIYLLLRHRNPLVANVFLPKPVVARVLL